MSETTDMIRAAATKQYVEGLVAIGAAAAKARQNESGLTPVEFFTVVALDPVEEKTKGGIILPNTTQEQDKLSTQEGTLVAVSPHAFSYAENWPEGTIPQVGQRVLFKRYAGALHEREIDGQKRSWRLLNDKDIIAIVEA